MTFTPTRRDLARSLAGAGVALALTRSLGAAARQSNGIASRGIGLSRTEWEAIYGPGEATQSLGMYTDPEYGGPIYVGLDFVNFDDGLVHFIELQWQNTTQLGGISPEMAGNQVIGMLPDDARRREGFTLLPTPGGPIALRAQRWTSATLGDTTDGRTSVLVTYQEKQAAMNPASGMKTIVTAATLAVEDA